MKQIVAEQEQAAKSGNGMGMDQNGGFTNTGEGFSGISGNGTSSGGFSQNGNGYGLAGNYGNGQGTGFGAGGNWNGTDTAVPARPTNTHFFMSAKLDNVRINKDVNTFVQEIINHLSAVDGATVELKLEVEVNAPNGIPSTTVRTVSENCRTLKVSDFGFDG